MEREKTSQRKRFVSTRKDQSESVTSNSTQGKYRTYDFGSNGLTPKKIYTKKSNGASYECISKSGTGSFGVVFKAKNRNSGKFVAIKRVLQDTRYKNRELEMMNMVNHTNVVELIDSFYEKTNEGVYLNLVLEFIPKDLYSLCNSTRFKSTFSIFHVKIFMYQIFRSLSHIHSLGICHRDIKPQNLLVNPETFELKLCDFGSAKILVPGEPNVSYICSRYYRAPELIIGATEYTYAIDLWSTGCVMSELLLGKPLFAAESGVDQLVEIIKILGTPTTEQMKLMNPDYVEIKFPQINPTPWEKVLPPNTPKVAIDLIEVLLTYVPTDRIDPLEACAHPFFDELRESNVRLSSGKPIPKLFNFNNEEIEYAKLKGFYDSLLPKHKRSNNSNDKM